jgi:RNA-directed DNA polymerase
MTAAFADTAIDDAFRWVCTQRGHFPANADIWHLRFHWVSERERLWNALATGTYRFDPLSVVKKASGDSIALWSATDALVIRCLTQWLHSRLPVHRACEHVRGHGGGRASVARVHRLLCTGRFPYVCRTDIRQYYANIDKTRLLAQLQAHVSDVHLFNLMTQIIHYSVEEGGEFHTPAKGIARGSALSPLLGAFHLYALDCKMAANPHINYVRYMDDFLIFARTRWHLRKAVKHLNHALASFGFEQHPDKTFIGHVDKGFDWMGFWFTHEGCTTVAPRALANHARKCLRLYEQTRRISNPFAVIRRVEAYQAKWQGWVCSLQVCVGWAGPVASTPT